MLQGSDARHLIRIEEGEGLLLFPAGACTVHIARLCLLTAQSLSCSFPPSGPQRWCVFSGLPAEDRRHDVQVAARLLRVQLDASADGGLHPEERRAAATQIRWGAFCWRQLRDGFHRREGARNRQGREGESRAPVRRRPARCPCSAGPAAVCNDRVDRG